MGHFQAYDVTMWPHSSSSALRWSLFRFNYYHNVEFVCFFENGNKFELNWTQSQILTIDHWDKGENINNVCREKKYYVIVQGILLTILVLKWFYHIIHIYMKEKINHIIVKLICNCIAFWVRDIVRISWKWPKWLL